MKRQKIVSMWTILSSVVVLFVLVGCEALLTSNPDSFGSKLKGFIQKPITPIPDDAKVVKVPPVTTDNADQLVKDAAMDPKQSQKVLEAIADKIKTATGEERATLTAAAVDAALNASGIMGAVMGKANDLMGALGGGEGDEGGDDGMGVIGAILGAVGGQAEQAGNAIAALTGAYDGNLDTLVGVVLAEDPLGGLLLAVGGLLGAIEGDITSIADITGDPENDEDGGLIGALTDALTDAAGGTYDTEEEKQAAIDEAVAELINVDDPSLAFAVALLGGIVGEGESDPVDIEVAGMNISGSLGVLSGNISDQIPMSPLALLSMLIYEPLDLLALLNPQAG
jgi:hypothetical protein